MPPPSAAAHPPRASANLEQLYHEALPMPNSALLSNSGPPNFVEGGGGGGGSDAGGGGSSAAYHQVSYFLFQLYGKKSGNAS